jgi:hypothetical protein
MTARKRNQEMPKPNQILCKSKDHEVRAAEPEALRLKYAHREAMLFWAVVSLVAFAGLVFVALGIPQGSQLVLGVLTGITGRGIFNSAFAGPHRNPSQE